MFLGERKPEILEETHTGMGRTHEIIRRPELKLKPEILELVILSLFYLFIYYLKTAKLIHIHCELYFCSNYRFELSPMYLFGLWAFWFWHFLQFVNTYFLQIRRRTLADSNFQVFSIGFKSGFWFGSCKTQTLFFSKQLFCSFCSLIWLIVLLERIYFT